MAGRFDSSVRSVLLDTNVLLDATTPARDLHRAARRVLDEWPNRGIQLCVSGQILREYLAVATRNAEVNGLGLAVEDALANVAAFKGRCRFLNEDREVAERLYDLLDDVACSGKQVHDANVVATCLVHGVPAIVTANTGDFGRFGGRVEVTPLGG